MRSLIASITGTRPGGRPALGRREPFWQRIHVDPWLLLLILVLATIAGFVLYSASSMSILHWAGGNAGHCPVSAALYGALGARRLYRLPVIAGGSRIGWRAVKRRTTLAEHPGRNALSAV